MESVLIFGASGHAKVIIDILQLQGKHTLAGLVDHSLPKGQEFCGLPIIGSDVDLPALVTQGFRSGIIAIGDNGTRAKVAEKVLAIEPHFQFINAIHPSAIIAKSVTIGEGTVIMAGACINPATKIGRHCIVNTGACIDHDNEIGDFASAAPGAVTGGGVKIGDFAALSLGAKVIHQIKIGRGAVIGAGSVVVKDIPDFVVAYGVPAVVNRSRTLQDKYL